MKFSPNKYFRHTDVYFILMIDSYLQKYYYCRQILSKFPSNKVLRFNSDKKVLKTLLEKVTEKHLCAVSSLFYNSSIYLTWLFNIEFSKILNVDIKTMLYVQYSSVIH